MSITTPLAHGKGLLNEYNKLIAQVYDEILLTGRHSILLPFGKFLRIAESYFVSFNTPNNTWPCVMDVAMEGNHRM